MKDYCPNCRIQAPHQDGRPGCPRCGGALLLIGEDGRVIRTSAALQQAFPQAALRQAPQAAPGQPNYQHRAPAMPGVPAQPPAAATVRPAPAPPVRTRPTAAPQRRRFGVRWVARKPPESRPGPRRQRGGTESPTPRYAQTPQWGLTQTFEPAPPLLLQDRIRAGDITAIRFVTRRTLWVLAGVMGLAALTEFWLYGLLVYNRSHPVGVSSAVAQWFAIIFGALSIVTVIAAAVTIATWVVAQRAEDHRRADLRDPRSPVQLFIGTIVPVVNLVWPMVYARELVDLRSDLPRDRSRRVVFASAGAWVFLNLWALATVIIRGNAESLQWQANSVLMTALCDLAVAVAALLLAETVRRLGDDAPKAASTKRWLVAA